MGGSGLHGTFRKGCSTSCQEGLHSGSLETKAYNACFRQSSTSKSCSYDLELTYSVFRSGDSLATSKAEFLDFCSWHGCLRWSICAMGPNLLKCQAWRLSLSVLCCAVPLGQARVLSFSQREWGRRGSSAENSA